MYRLSIWNSTYYAINNMQSEMLAIHCKLFMHPPMHSAVMHFQSLAPSQQLSRDATAQYQKEFHSVAYY